MAPSTHTAAVVTDNGEVEVKKIAVPNVGEGEVLVKVFAAALNPTDCESTVVVKIVIFSLSPGKTVRWWTTPGSVSGFDFAGVIEELGPGAEATGVKGVWGPARGRRLQAHRPCSW